MFYFFTKAHSYFMSFFWTQSPKISNSAMTMKREILRTCVILSAQAANAETTSAQADGDVSSPEARDL
jgi:hypothetical protein